MLLISCNVFGNTPYVVSNVNGKSTSIHPFINEMKLNLKDFSILFSVFNPGWCMIFEEIHDNSLLLMEICSTIIKYKLFI